MTTLYWTIVACGAGTFLLRWLPFHASRGGDRPPGDGLSWHFLEALGPAAIAALCVVALWPQLPPRAPLHQLWAVFAGVVGVVVAHRLRGGVVVPVVTGVAIHASASWLTR